MDYKKYHRDKIYQENESHFKNIFKKRVDIVLRYVKKGRVLDIGASTGAMLDLFKEEGFETWGVEPSASSDVALEKGHKIAQDFFEKTKLRSNYFDVVIMNHTLEHLSDPLGILLKIHRILKNKGILLIDVPNAGSLGSKILKDRWPYRLPDEHKQQFTKDTLEQVFKKSGFKVIYSESRSGIFEFAHPIEEIGESLVTGKKRFFTNLINIPYDIFVTTLNMGDSITMVGRRE